MFSNIKPESCFVNTGYDKDGDMIYICPICDSHSGVRAPMCPENLFYFHHYNGCPNAGKLPLIKETSVSGVLLQIKNGKKN